MKQQKTERQKKLMWRRICIIFDAAVVVLLGVFAVCMLLRTPSTNYDVDRLIYPVKGIDLSAHNGEVDFARVAADSVSFVMLKATEGTDFCDAKFNTNYLGARQAGLKVGAYHFFRFDSPGYVQTQHFLRSISGRTFDLPLAIDVEKWGNPNSYDPDSVKQSLRIMVDEIRQAGYDVMIYTNKSGYSAFIDDDFDDVPLWICSLSAVPSVEGWHLWQHSHRNHVDGVNGIVDLNTFNGDLLRFNQWSRPYDVIINGDGQ